MYEMSVYDRPYFNSLPSIEEAFSSVESGGQLEHALVVLGRLFVKHRVHREWGLCLLHKHWRLKDGELPIQIVKDRNEQELVTEPRGEGFKSDFFPTVYSVRLIRDDFVVCPVEFSTDRRALDANGLLLTHPAFTREFNEALVSNRLEQLFGLILARSVHLPGHELVEYTYSDRVSVLKEEPIRDDRARLIQTSWVFLDSKNPTVCVPNQCLAACDVTSSGHSQYHSPPYHDPQPDDSSVKFVS